MTAGEVINDVLALLALMPLLAFVPLLGLIGPPRRRRRDRGVRCYPPETLQSEPRGAAPEAAR